MKATKRAKMRGPCTKEQGTKQWLQPSFLLLETRLLRCRPCGVAVPGPWAAGRVVWPSQGPGQQAAWCGRPRAQVQAAWCGRPRALAVCGILACWSWPPHRHHHQLGSGLSLQAASLHQCKRVQAMASTGVHGDRLGSTQDGREGLHYQGVSGAATGASLSPGSSLIPCK